MDRFSEHPACAGLSHTIAWDQPSALRGELYGADHLRDHAMELAKAHGLPSRRASAGPLRQRFAAAKARIHQAYEILRQDEYSRRDPSPAEEWLLDNSHVVDDQIREIQEDLPWAYLVQLPRLTQGTMRGYPRVYGMCLDYLRHTDARIDFNTLASYVIAYQSVHELTIGELWATPIMLRLGLILTVGALAASEVNARDRARANAWADRLLRTGMSAGNVATYLRDLERSQSPASAAFLVQLLRRLREQDAPLAAVSNWIREQCSKLDSTPEELTRRQNLRQAADQVSVGNAISSMRAIAALDWGKFFEQVSSVEAILHQDPTAAYGASDRITRDRCRHAVESLARRCRDKSESQIARIALDLAINAHQASPEKRAQSHVGYYLVDSGRGVLERLIHYRPRWSERLVRPILAHPSLFYLGAIALITLALLFEFQKLLSFSSSPLLFCVCIALALLPASELASSFVGALVMAILPPRLLPKLALKQGIPQQYATLVVVPALLDNADTVRNLLEDLEIRSLANPERHLYFALLTDFLDAPQQKQDGDAELLALAVRGIQVLNERHRGADDHRFWLMHRRRLENKAQGVFMGWERKRGKLEELNRWLRGADDTSFDVITAPSELRKQIQFVITLDADTRLPRDVARKLIGALAHPLNEPVIDQAKQRVVRGHAVIQPRVGTVPGSSRQSRFARIFTGPPGIDPYTTAVSDIYQDLFGEGSFVGKGIYHVDAFHAALAGRVPENALLSHDLFEGCLARSALATDIEVLDEQPASYSVVASRHHRWVRGDWQLLPWLLPRVRTHQGTAANPLRAIDYWKFLDNLRRSLLKPALLVLALWGWFSGPDFASLASLGVLGVYLVPLFSRLLLETTRGAARANLKLEVLGGDLKTNLLQLGLNIAFMVDQALVELDAITRTLFRLFVSKRRLLEWTTMSQASRQAKHSGTRLALRTWLALSFSIATLAALAVYMPTSLAAAGVLLLPWFAAPFLGIWLSRKEPPPKLAAALSSADVRFLRNIARKTWRFFATFVGAEDNWLPPDNYQEDPRGVVAHRTSPTNIGLYLLSVVAARDFGFINLKEVVERLSRTLATIERLERRNGHILNWYETTTLRPLEPQYVSTVDSGNFAAYLWTLRGACAEFAQADLFHAAPIEAAKDALELALKHAQHHKIKDSKLTRKIGEQLKQLSLARKCANSSESWQQLGELNTRLQELKDSVDATDKDNEVVYWLQQAASAIHDSYTEVSGLMPFLAELRNVPNQLNSDARFRAQLDTLRTANSPLQIARASQEGLVLCDALLAEAGQGAAEVSYLQGIRKTLEQACAACDELIEALNQVGTQAMALGDGMDFRFLFDDERALFAIGYNVSSMRLDGSHYDLLASEARLASLFAIAKGDAPQEHWFRVGRPRAAQGSTHSLLSWSGSMFEYLMPLLVTKNYPDTLLAETYLAAVKAQQKYATSKGLPWGISEAAYNVMDLSMTYQYRAFGVPGLGLKAGLAEDLVIAPYATVLAALVEPKAAVNNLHNLANDGLYAAYGFYESIDFTPSHVPPGRRGVIVKAFMAHHQGMSLVALDNVLNGMPMPRRFHAEPRIKASALLLEERVPIGTPLVEVRSQQMSAPLLAEPELHTAEHIGLAAPGGTRVHLLGHGELSTLLTSAGAGTTTWKQLDVNRFREDSALDAGGTYIYVRDHTRRRVWSTTYLPTRTTPDFYNAAFHIDRVEFHRRDGDIETLTEVVVSPEHPAEVRRITLTNHDSEAHDVDITSYMDVVLAPHAADVAHPAFSSMFIETEAFPERGALVAHRRPRSAGEPAIWLVQLLLPETDGFKDFGFDTARVEFLGRTGNATNPRSMGFDSRLSERVGNVLDPAFVMRRNIRLQGGARATLTLTTALASSREAALQLIEIHSAPHHTNRTFELGWADARVELKHLGVTAAQSHRFQRLLSAILFPLASLRSTPPPLGNAHASGRNALWAQGISGDLPMLVLRVDDADCSEICREILLAHEFWRLNGFVADLVILNEEPSGYMQPLQEALLDLIRTSPAESHLDQRGGVFVRRVGLLSDETRQLLLRAARVVLRVSQGTLAQQLRRAAQDSSALPKLLALAPPKHTAALPEPLLQKPELLFENGLGGFSKDGREYVLFLDPAHKTPMPWCNVMANAHFGSVVSESALGCTWYGNSQRHRITPWSNDVATDAAGEIIYVRDEDDGSTWSLTPLPLGGNAKYLVRHGAGYTVFEHIRNGIKHTVTVFVSVHDSIKLYQVKLQNLTGKTRRLSIYGYIEWVLGNHREAARILTSTEWAASHGAMLASNLWSAFPERCSVFFSTEPVRSFTANREEFFGMCGSRAQPAALKRTTLAGQVGGGTEPCAALQLAVSLSNEATFAFGLGDSENRASALQMAKNYSAMAQVTQALDAVHQHWDQVLGSVEVATPSPELNLMANRWLLYQALSCRIWGRSGFYQSSGAYGYRDQLQDVLALLHSCPELAREHILRAAGRQFAEGDVQHWWHPETGEGIRSRCSDDLLWLPYATAEYVHTTDDYGILDENIPFLSERVLKPGENDIFGSPQKTAESYSLYEHCVRALEAGSTEGPHGIPLIKGGDWNDGMNRIGREGSGESIWLGWFLAKTLREFSGLAKARADASRALWCNVQIARITQAIETHGWDGAWYRRAFFDNGSPVGSQPNAECQIDSIAQSWAVISGSADKARAAQALNSAWDKLVREPQKLALLLTPAFEHAEPDPGYIRSYPAGIRENGGQYTHGVLWTIFALCLQNDGDRAFRLFSLLNPITHGKNASDLKIYKVEPYVVAADVYFSPQHMSRGGWTWYTGSAAWMYRAAVEAILGLRRRGQKLLIFPCIPRAWDGFSAIYRYGKSSLEIHVENPEHVCTGVATLSVDGRQIDGNSVELNDDGRRRQIHVVLGGAVSDAHPILQEKPHARTGST